MAPQLLCRHIAEVYLVKLVYLFICLFVYYQDYMKKKTVTPVIKLQPAPVVLILGLEVLSH